MGFNFPSSPAIGELYPASPAAGQPQYRWDGAAWVAATGLYASDFVKKTGDTMTGALVLPGNPTSALEAAPKRYVDSQIAPQCGYLYFVNTVTIKFSPLNGDRIKVNGVIYRIPAGGITINNINVFVSGVPGQNLAANTPYYVFAFINAGTVTLDFWPIGVAAHATSTTAGNEGVEIKTGDDSRTLIGLVYTNATSAQFASICVLSWFNRRDKGAQGSGNSSGDIALIIFTTWGDESLTLNFAGSIACNQPSLNSAQASVDGGLVGPSIQATVPANGYYCCHAATMENYLSEGAHSFAVRVGIGAGGTQAPFHTSVKVRG